MLTIEELRDRLDASGQGHVLAHWDGLDEDARAALLAQLTRLAPRLDELLAARGAALEQRDRGAHPALSPAPAIALPASAADRARDEDAGKRGEQLLREGRLAAFVVAGGQGTRLGFDGPKGLFPIGPVSDRTLFEIQAQKLRGLSRRIGVTVPWYVMTSAATDAATREAFEAADHYGLDPRDVLIFQQDMVPAFDFEGRLILETPGRVFENPNGHGGAITALASSGAIEDMERRGIDTIFYYQVDNPLVRIGDPVYVGHHAGAGAEISCKVVRKTDPEEKVGVVCEVDGRPGIVEYTELADEERYAVDSEGRLRFWAGNVAIHLLSTDFVRRLAERAFECLPFHLSAKKIPTVDANGRPVEPDAPNGHKLERFVFDALPAAKRVCVVETTTAEFAPLKNAEGADSPARCRAALTEQYRAWLEAAGVEVPPDVTALEIDHSRIDGPADAVAAAYSSLDDAGDVVRVER